MRNATVKVEPCLVKRVPDLGTDLAGVHRSGTRKKSRSPSLCSRHRATLALNYKISISAMITEGIHRDGDEMHEDAQT